MHPSVARQLSTRQSCSRLPAAEDTCDLKEGSKIQSLGAPDFSEKREGGTGLNGAAGGKAGGSFVGGSEQLGCGDVVSDAVPGARGGVSPTLLSRLRLGDILPDTCGLAFRGLDLT